VAGSLRSQMGFVSGVGGERCLLEKATSYEEGERIAQKYMAAEKLRRQHRELVMSAFAA